MNKSEFISAVASEAGVTKGVAEKVIGAVASAVVVAVNGGDDVKIGGLGTFKAHKTAARVARNPRTGEQVNVAARNIIKFKIDKGVSEGLNRR